MRWWFVVLVAALWTLGNVGAVNAPDPGVGPTPDVPPIPYAPFYIAYYAGKDVEALLPEAAAADFMPFDAEDNASRDAFLESVGWKVESFLAAVESIDPSAMYWDAQAQAWALVPPPPETASTDPHTEPPTEPEPEPEPQEEPTPDEAPDDTPDEPPAEEEPQGEDGDASDGPGPQPQSEPQPEPQQEPDAEPEPQQEPDAEPAPEEPAEDPIRDVRGIVDTLPLDPTLEAIRESLDPGALPVPLVPEVEPQTPQLGEPGPMGPPAPASAFAPASADSVAEEPPLSPGMVGAIVAGAALAGGAAAATQLGVGLALRRWLWLGLFSRIAKSDVLDHDTRQTLLDHLRANPGASVTELQDLVGRSINSVTHHLRVLESNGLVRGVKSGRRRCYFALDDNLSPKERVATATLTSESTRRVYAAIAKRPGICQRDLAQMLDITPTSVVFHARRLEEAGVIRRAREGRLMAYFPSGEVAA